MPFFAAQAKNNLEDNSTSRSRSRTLRAFLYTVHQGQKTAVKCHYRTFRKVCVYKRLHADTNFTRRLKYSRALACTLSYTRVPARQ